MSLRIIELHLPVELSQKLNAFVKHLETGLIVQHSVIESLNDNCLHRFLVPTSSSEKLTDKLRKEFSQANNFRIIILVAEATIPQVLEDKNPVLGSDKGWLGSGMLDRVGRDELLVKIKQMVKVSPTFCALVVLSTIMAAVGLYQNNLVVILGAMVVAPLLGPNIALAFATTLGDLDLVRKALKINMVGSGSAFFLSVCLGLLWEGDPEIHSLSTRVNVGVGDIVLAFCSGIAGVLSLTGGTSTALVGVMVAVALLPPLVAAGLLISSGYLEAAFTSVLLLGINIISVNLAAVFTFIVQKIHPFNWWDSERAKGLIPKVIFVWVILLIILFGLLILRASFVLD